MKQKLWIEGTEYGHRYNVIFENDRGYLGIRQCCPDKARIRLEFKHESPYDYENMFDYFEIRSGKHASCVVERYDIPDAIREALKILTYDKDIKSIVEGFGLNAL